MTYRAILQSLVCERYEARTAALRAIDESGLSAYDQRRLEAAADQHYPE